MKFKNRIIIPIDVERSHLTEIQHPLMVQTLDILVVEGTHTSTY